MNISQILENLGEDRADFIEALSDASHYLWTAIDLLDPKDQVTLRALLGARDAIDEVLGACEADDDDDDDDLDFSGIEKAIASENPQTSIRGLIISEFGEVA